MQLSQLYRRGVVRPLDEAAAIELETSDVRRPIRVEWLAVLGNDQFNQLWATGVFEKINRACNIKISDYEEVRLSAGDVSKSLQLVRAMDTFGGEVGSFFRGLESLLAEAAAANQSVYFIF